MNRLSPPPFASLDDVRRAVDWALITRRSVRAFLHTPVPREEIESILDVARFSATGVNMQPWHVHVVTGAMKSRLSAAIKEVNDDPGRSSVLEEPYDYYPREWVAPYLDRRRNVGWSLYGLLGIEKGDKERMHTQHGNPNLDPNNDCSFNWFRRPRVTKNPAAVGLAAPTNTTGSNATEDF